MAACTTVGQPLAAPQAVGHHTAVDSILHCSVPAGSPGGPGAHRSQGVGSSQGPDAPRLAPGGVRHQAAGRSTQPLAQREAAGHDSGAVLAALPSHGGGAPRIITLPMSSRTHDFIHCASASATNSASFITCPS